MYNNYVLIKFFNLNLSLLIIRIFSGGFMLIYHGIPKLENFSRLSTRFADPLGISSPASLSLVIFAEVVCCICLIFGIAVRLVVIPLIITMLVAVFIIHADDPMSRKELAIAYLFNYLALFVGGSGRYSIMFKSFLPNHPFVNWAFDRK